MKKTTAFLIVLFFLGRAQAQVDAHFSQYYAHPLWLNPAMTGAFEGKVRVSGIYRSQWGSVTNPFSTAGLSVDMNTNKNINIGVGLLDQTAGDAGYHFMNGGLSLAYSGLRFGADENQQVIVGMNFGFLSRRFDRSKFEFGDQWNPSTGYDPNAPTADQISKTSASSFDAGAGIVWIDGAPEKTFNGFAGFSAAHLTKPQDPFLSGNKSFLPVRYAFHGGVKITLSEVASVTPNFLYMRQGNASETMVGASAELTVSNDASILFGVNYRIEDAVAPFAGLHFQNMTLGVSYDSNVSNLGKMTGNANSFEASLSFIVPKSEYKGIPCPRF